MRFPSASTNRMWDIGWVARLNQKGWWKSGNKFFCHLQPYFVLIEVPDFYVNVDVYLMVPLDNNTCNADYMTSQEGVFTQSHLAK